MIKNEFLQQMGNKIKEARESKGLTVRQLGEMCDMDYSHISRFENGHKNIRILTLKTVAEKLNVDLKDFI